MTNTKTYAGSFIYANDTLEYALFDEGRLIDESGTFKYQYFLKDHLGNTRVTFTDSDADGTAEILQQDHYYPFGINFAGIANASSANPTNFYKYNGKEKQDEFGLNWYDYGARFYDPVIARFTTIDPLAETYNSHSTYHYALNNPIRYKDFFGMGAEEKGKDEEEKQEQQKTTEEKKPKAEEKKEVSEMTTSEKGVDFIASYEGLELEIYDDAAGYATIGYGHLIHKGKKGTNTEKKRILRMESLKKKLRNC